MIFKEPGYDEFLAKEIQDGLDDAANGRYCTAEQFKQEMESLLTRKEQELQSLEGNVVYG
nr:hypothetical protein [uncultured Aggregatibacter sp.]